MASFYLRHVLRLTNQQKHQYFIMSYVFVTFTLVDLFVIVDRKRLHGTDVLLINIIISVYCCI